MECRLDGPRTAFFLDNKIAGAAWLPTSAVLELAAEGAATALGAGAGAPTTLASLVLPSGLPLSQLKGAAAAVVTCTLQAATGLIEIQAAAPHQPTHRHALLFATLARAAAPVSPAAAGRAAPSIPQRLAQTPFIAAALRQQACRCRQEASTPAAFAAVGATPDTDGLLINPCAVESALQLEGVQQVAAVLAATASTAAAGIDQHESELDSEEEAALLAAPIKVPATIAAFQISSSGGSGNNSSNPYAYAAPPALTDGPVGSRALSSMWLLPGGPAAAGGGNSSAAAPCCQITDIDFRSFAFGALDLTFGAGEAGGAAEEEEEELVVAGPAPWSTDLESWEVEEIVAEAVESILGQPVAADEPLMAAGLDSLGAVELRAALRERLGGLTLPSTLLYDHQSVAAIAAFITEDLGSPEPLNGDGGNGDALAAAPGTRPGTAAALAAQLGPSSLLKLLRGAPTPRPLFLAAPGVANAQSAYVSC